MCIPLLFLLVTSWTDRDSLGRRFLIFESSLPIPLRVFIMGVPYAISVFLCIPSSAMGTFVGLVQGVPLAFLTVTVGEAVGSIACYFCVRKLGFDVSVRVPESIRKVFISPTHCLRASIAFRMLPLPTCLKNYGLVLSTGINFRTFLIGVLLGGMPYVGVRICFFFLFLYHSYYLMNIDTRTSTLEHRHSNIDTQTSTLEHRYNIFFPLLGTRVRDTSELFSWSWFNVFELVFILTCMVLVIKWARAEFDSQSPLKKKKNTEDSETKGADDDIRQQSLSADVVFEV